MYFIILLMIDAAAGFLSALPFLIILEILARRQIPALPLRHLIGDGIFCFFLSAILSVTGIPAVYELKPGININLIPFADLASNTLQYAENLLLFLPVGFLLPVLFPHFRNALRCVRYGFFFSLAVELMQLFCLRATDIDDLIMNTLGCAAGYGLFLLLQNLCPALAQNFAPLHTVNENAAEACPSGQVRRCNKKEPPALLKLETHFLTAASWAGGLLLTPAIKELIWGILTLSV